MIEFPAQDTQICLKDKISRVFIIVGDSGSGKTQMLKQLTSYYNGYYIDCLNVANLAQKIVVIKKDESIKTALLNLTQYDIDKVFCGLPSGIQSMIHLFGELALNTEKTLFCIDFPETSIHLQWQIQLINHLVSICSCSSFVIATHAPGIFQNGWNDRIFRFPQEKGKLEQEVIKAI